MDLLPGPLGHDLDAHGDRRPPESHAGLEPDHVADQDRLLELDAVDGDGDDLGVRRAAAEGDLAAGGGGPGHVDVGEDDAAEDGAVRVGVPWHHDDLDGGVGVGHERS